MGCTEGRAWSLPREGSFSWGLREEENLTGERPEQRPSGEEGAGEMEGVVLSDLLPAPVGAQMSPPRGSFLIFLCSSTVRCLSSVPVLHLDCASISLCCIARHGCISVSKLP